MWRHFNQFASRYDAWFDRFPGNEIFPLEVECVKCALKGAPKPWCEIGVGSGRFAQALGITKGIDPSVEVLRYARERGIEVTEANAESLPFSDGIFGSVIMVVTLCFLDDVNRAFNEFNRVLMGKGSIIIGMVPRESPWGKFYQEKKREGRPFYSDAHFFSVDETEKLINKHGLKVRAIYSTLVDPPGRSSYPYYDPIEGFSEDAGFVAIRADKVRA